MVAEESESVENMSGTKTLRDLAQLRSQNGSKRNIFPSGLGIEIDTPTMTHNGDQIDQTNQTVRHSTNSPNSPHIS